MKAKNSSVRDVFGINDEANNPVLAIHVFSKLDSTGNGQVRKEIDSLPTQYVPSTPLHYTLIGIPKS